MRRTTRNRFTHAAGRKTPVNPVTRCPDGIDRITFDSVGQAVIDSMADYAQNEGNRGFIESRLASHMDGLDSWANNFTRAKLLGTIANPPKHLVDAVEQMREALVD